MKTKYSYKEAREAIAEKSKLVSTIFGEAGPDLDFTRVKCLGDGDTKAKTEKVTQLNAELADLNSDIKEYEALELARKNANDLNDAFNKPAENIIFPGKGTPQPEIKSLGELIMASKAVTGEGIRVRFDLDPVKSLLAPERKADFFTTSGWAPENLRQPGYVAAPLRPIAVIDNLPIYPTTQNSVAYMLESTATNNAAEKTEGNAAIESALALTATTEAVQEVGTFVPTSRVQLEDVALAQAYLTNRLTFFVRQRMDLQILRGDGQAPNLKGTVNIGGSLQTQAKGTDPGPDAIYKAFTKIRTVGFTEPSVIFTHDNDWQDIRLLRTADGIYIFGNPSDPGPYRIWGVPVVVTTAAAENTMVCGDYANFAYVAMRRGVEVEMSSGYSDYFVKGKLAVLATLRCAVVHTRTAAFATVTGM